MLKLIPELKHAVLEIVLQQKQSITEYELITLLKQPPYELLPADILSHTKSLFQCHFIIFHVLYVLQDELNREGAFALDIEPLGIVLREKDEVTTMQHAVEELRTAEAEVALRDYYLNLDEYLSTTEADVEVLLETFWQSYIALPQQQNKFTLEEALKILELPKVPLYQKELKKQFRRLAHQYHPDKGGQHELMQDLQLAYHRVLQAFV